MPLLVDTLVHVCDSGMEDMKVLQCVLSLAATTTLLHAEPLAKVILLT